MPRYFFNLRHRPGSAGLAMDQEGEELADVSAARERALAQAGAMIARERHTFNRDWRDCTFEIVDENGQSVLTVPFSDTLPDDDQG